MLTGSVNADGLDGLLTKLREFRALDLSILAKRVGAIVEEGNRAGLLAGLDADGEPMAPVAESTIRRGRGGDGPPTVPRYEASSLIRGFSVRVVFVAENRFKVVASFAGLGEIVRFFQAGTRHMPARPVVGIRPVDREKIQEALDEFTRQQAARFA